MLSITDVPHSGQLEDELCWIYALVDPRTNEVRYIGVSRNVRQRIREHVNGFSNCHLVIDWVRKLKRAGLKPNVYLLQAVDPERRALAEIQWIHGCLERGANLLNVIHSGRRLNSLNKTEIRRTTPPRSGRVRRGDEIEAD